MRKLVTFLIAALLITTNAYADDVETKFKKIGHAIAVEFTRSVYGGQIAPAGQEKLIPEWRKELKNLVILSPNSIWADDAQYIISIISVEDPNQNVIELEKLLKEYPDFHIEDWTRKNLVLLASSETTPCISRIELCCLYKRLGLKTKLQISYSEGIDQCPYKKEIFNKILKSSESSKT